MRSRRPPRSTIIAAAKAWLAEGGLESVLGSDGTLEKKIKR